MELLGDRDRAKAASELIVEVIKKGELGDHGRERKERRQTQARRDLYTVLRYLEPYVNLIVRMSIDRLRWDYNPDATQWSMSGEWPVRKRQIMKEKGYGR